LPVSVKASSTTFSADSHITCAGATEPAENGNEDGGSAAKRRRRSEDRDVGEAAADGISQGQVNGVVPVNGHAATEANGSVAPEAAFWSALEDAKDEVRAYLSLLKSVLLYAWSCVLFCSACAHGCCPCLC
jgi:hypothetical protein